MYFLALGSSIRVLSIFVALQVQILGYIPIPKSINSERILLNMADGFDLAESQMDSRLNFLPSTVELGVVPPLIMGLQHGLLAQPPN